MPFGAALILECCIQANGDSGAGKKQLPAALRARLAARGIIKVRTHPHHQGTHTPTHATLSNQQHCLLNTAAKSVAFSQLFALFPTLNGMPTSLTVRLARAHSSGVLTPSKHGGMQPCY